MTRLSVPEVLGAAADLEGSAWTNWSDQRPPNDPGVYWWRIEPRTIGGLENMRPEWVARMSLHGMGHADHEYWPDGISHWNGYKRTAPAGLQWRCEADTPKDGERWPGLEIAPCPFCGKVPRLRHVERGSSGGVVIMGDRIWTHNNFWLEHRDCVVPSTAHTSLAALVAAWNRRPQAEGGRDD